MNLNTLNTIIAMVIVLLVLSLVVQAIQTFIKKLFKLKSRQIVDSLEDLYEQALRSVSAGAPERVATSPTGELAQAIRTTMTWIVTKPRKLAGSLAELYNALVKGGDAGAPAAGAAGDRQIDAGLFTQQVLGEFRKIGRVTKFGNAILDSLAKEDLLKVMAKLKSRTFSTDYARRFQTLYDDLVELQKATASQ